MAIININTILGWFKAGKKPTEQQFTDTWNSFWHKEEVIPQATIEDLESDLGQKATQEDLEAHINDPNAHGGTATLQQVLDAGSTAVTSTTFNLQGIKEEVFKDISEFNGVEFIWDASTFHSDFSSCNSIILDPNEVLSDFSSDDSYVMGYVTVDGQQSGHYFNNSGYYNDVLVWLMYCDNGPIDSEPSAVSIGFTLKDNPDINFDTDEFTIKSTSTSDSNLAHSEFKVTPSQLTFGTYKASGGGGLYVDENFSWGGSGNVSLGCSGTISMSPSGGSFSLGNNQGVIQAGSGGTISFDASNGVSISGNLGGIALNGNSKGVSINGQGGSVKIETGAGNTGAIYAADYSDGFIDRSLVDKAYVDSTLINAGGTGLEKITENNNTGWRLKGVDQNNYGPIGHSAVDLSISESESDNKGAIGAFSFASGSDNEAAGDFSFATGRENKANGDFSFAAGNGNTAGGDYSFIAGGQSNTASGAFSFASGSGNTAAGTFSSATGSGNTISTSGYFSLVTGRDNKIDSAFSFAAGSGNTISQSAYMSMVSGQGNVVDGYQSFAIGYGNKLDCGNSIVFGENNTNTVSAYSSIVGGSNSSSTSTYSITVGSGLKNNGYCSALFGSGNTTNNSDEFVAGNGNTANGYATLTTGYGNTTNGDFSFAQGYSLTANTFAETVLGSFAKTLTGNGGSASPSDPAFRVGVGTSDTDRKDAIVVYKSGLITAPESTLQSIMSSDKKTLITKEYIDNAISSSGSIATLGTVLKTDSNATGISTDIVMQTSAQVKIDSGTSLTVGTSNASGNLYITSAVSRLQSNAGYVELASSANVNIVSNTNLINVTGNTYPTTTSAYDFGSSSLLWKNIWATTGNFSAINITTAPTANTTGTIWLTRNTSTGAIESTLPGYALATGLTTAANSSVPSATSNIVVNLSRIYGNLLTLRAYAAKTAAYTILSTDDTIDFTGATTATATLLTAVGYTGKRFTIKNSGTGVITLATTSSQTIDGATTFTLPNQYSSITVQSDGANWKIMSVYGLQGEGTLSKSAAYTITAADYRYGQVTVFADASSAAFTITLEASASMVGKTVNVIKTDSSANQVTIKGNGTTNINAANTQVLSSQYQAVKVKSNSTQYYLI
ncbi:beta strand repeat-containing protein [Flavobacterium sp. RHBU_3]|uniref:beta strand repeat-containing protein n=1 Tax=Flavobacterium sp. RHBU_3 TaxID=3391184 RepID=UPI0039851DF3